MKNSKVHIVQIIQSLTISSGVTTFVSEIASEQRHLQENVSVCCQWHPDLTIPGITVHTSPDISSVLCNILHSRTSECYGDDCKQVVHIHGIWSYYCLNAMRWCHHHNIPYIISPHGGLMPRVFSKGRIKKFIFFHFFLKPLLKNASMIHCTSEAEVAACKSLGFSGPYVIAPLGVKLPELNKVVEVSGYVKRVQTILFLGRLGEEKGLLNLLSAWKRLHAEAYGQEWVLKLAGPDWLDYKKKLLDKIESEQITGIEFTGPADDELKDHLYREADIFVLPSPMENFSMVVLDALAYGVPTIATKGTPWEELESERCGLWIDQGDEALFQALSRLMKLNDAERKQLGANGRMLAALKYQWPAITKKILTAYKEICC